MYEISSQRDFTPKFSWDFFRQICFTKKGHLLYLFSQEWETEAVDLDMAGLGSQEDLRLDLAGGRDDLHCPNDKPIYVSSIAKGSFLEGKLK